jgi:hypothetical protein
MFCPNCLCRHAFRFFIDRFHTYNHRYDACGDTFNIKRFRLPADVAEAFGHINTEVCEQWHASVDMLTRHVASMSQFHFMLTLQVPPPPPANECLLNPAALFRSTMPRPAMHMLRPARMFSRCIFHCYRVL